MPDVPDAYPLTLTELAAPFSHLRWRREVTGLRGMAREIALRPVRAALDLARSLPVVLRGDAGAGEAPIRRLEPGARPAEGARSVALFIHYSRSGRISAMVQAQLAALVAEGFAPVFITMAEGVPEADWAAAGAHAALMVQRRNHGLDFGAWHDLAPVVAARWPEAEELLLANDSVLGPVLPLGPVMAALRSGGPGLFGLTESLQGNPHLQSYFLLARGTTAVADSLEFLRTLRLSPVKSVVIRRGELRFSQWMRERGHRVAALFGHARLIDAVLTNPAELRRVIDGHPWLRRREARGESDWVALLHGPVLNPTHHLWLPLLRRFGFPFIKTELVTRNPAGIPDARGWRAAVPAEAPCPVPLLEAHLASLPAAPLP